MIIQFPVERTKRGQLQALWDNYQSARWAGGMDDLPDIIRTPEFERAFKEIVCTEIA